MSAPVQKPARARDRAKDHLKDLARYRQPDLLSWRPVSIPQSDPAVTSTPQSAHCGVTQEYPAKIPPHPPNIKLRCGAEVGDPAVGTPQSGEPALESFETAGATAGDRSAQGGAERTGVLPPALRPYQLEAISAVRAEFERGCKSTLLVQATGTGKTVEFAELARIWKLAGDRTLVLVHREELIDQAEEKFADIGVTVGVEQGKRRAGSADVVIASVQTLQRARLAAYPRDYFRRIIIDEGHHAPAASYQAILDHFADAFVLGVTATPSRVDGKALGKIYATVAFRYELRAAIADRWLVPLRARRIVLRDVDLGGVRVHRGDLDQRELADVLSADKALHGVVVPLLEQAGPRRTIVFGVDVAHAHALAACLNSYRPGCARALDGSAKRDERRATRAAFRRGEFQFLVNCALFTEGFDEPSVSCVAIVRPTQSWSLYVQMLGRVTRLLGLSYAASVAAGKSEGLLLDFVGNSAKHRLIGPADALAGAELDAEVSEHAAHMLSADGEQLELEEVLAAADAEVRLRRERLPLVAKAAYRAKEIDPFLGDFFTPNFDAPWAHEPATSKQREALEARGLEKLPDALTKGEASQWLTALVEREKQGLATISQARCLSRCKCNVDGLTFVEAQRLMAKLRRGNFKPWALAGEPRYLGKTDRAVIR